MFIKQSEDPKGTVTFVIYTKIRYLSGRAYLNCGKNAQGELSGVFIYTLLNRLSHLKHKIEKQWLDLSLDAFKVKCKKLFLQT